MSLTYVNYLNMIQVAIGIFLLLIVVILSILPLFGINTLFGSRDLLGFSQGFGWVALVVYSITRVMPY